MTPLDPAVLDTGRLVAEEVAEYLRRTPRQLPPKYFYDELGSALFDAICRLPWYKVTRSESALLQRHGPALFEGLARPLTLVELGCGNGEKLAALAQRTAERFQSIHLVDISGAALDAAQPRLEALDCGPVVRHQGTYESGVASLAGIRRAGSLVVLFLGSNIGNFEPGPARAFLDAIRGPLLEGDALVIGSDLVKPERDLVLAYDDPLQVTAAFNRNVLRRLNEELDATFDLDAWSHRAVWNRACRRVEMHLVSREAQHIRIPACNLDLSFQPGETIWTESSYKYEAADLVRMGETAGFTTARQWVDESARFALSRLSV